MRSFFITQNDMIYGHTLKQDYETYGKDGLAADIQHCHK